MQVLSFAQHLHLYSSQGPGQMGQHGSGRIQIFAHAIWIENKKYFHRKDIINCGLVNHTSPMTIWPIGFLLSSFSLNFLLTSFVLNVAVVSKTHFSLRSIKHLLHNSGLLLHHYYVDMFYLNNFSFCTLLSRSDENWECTYFEDKCFMMLINFAPYEYFALASSAAPASARCWKHHILYFHITTRCSPSVHNFNKMMQTQHFSINPYPENTNSPEFPKIQILLNWSNPLFVIPAEMRQCGGISGEWPSNIVFPPY